MYIRKLPGLFAIVVGIGSLVGYTSMGSPGVGWLDFCVGASAAHSFILGIEMLFKEM